MVIKLYICLKSGSVFVKGFTEVQLGHVGERAPPNLVPDLKRKTFSLSLLSMTLAVGFLNEYY